MKTGCNPGSGAIGKVKIRTTTTLETTMFACECEARLAEKSGIMPEPLAESATGLFFDILWKFIFFMELTASFSARVKRATFK